MKRSLFDSLFNTHPCHCRYILKGIPRTGRLSRREIEYILEVADAEELVAEEAKLIRTALEVIDSGAELNSVYKRRSRGYNSDLIRLQLAWTRVKKACYFAQLPARKNINLVPPINTQAIAFGVPKISKRRYTHMFGIELKGKLIAAFSTKIATEAFIYGYQTAMYDIHSHIGANLAALCENIQDQAGTE